MREQLEAFVQQLVEKGVRYDAAVQDFEKAFISRVMERVKGNQSRAARMLGMHRNTLSRKIAEYNLTQDFRRPLGKAATSQSQSHAQSVARGFGGRR